MLFRNWCASSVLEIMIRALEARGILALEISFAKQPNEVISRMSSPMMQQLGSATNEL